MRIKNSPEKKLKITPLTRFFGLALIALGIGAAFVYADPGIFKESETSFIPTSLNSPDTKESTSQQEFPDLGTLPPRSSQEDDGESRGVKIAFIADSEAGEPFESVLNLIKAEGADMVLHQGDFAYGDGASVWSSKISRILGSGIVYLGSVGNHDDWGEYSGFFGNQLRMMARDNTLPDPDTEYAVTYRGIKIVFFNSDKNRSAFIEKELAGDTSVWKICSMHESPPRLSAEKYGGETENGEACRKHGALIVSAHSHQYNRSVSLIDTDPPTIDMDPQWSGRFESRVGGGATVAFVTGLGGAGISGRTNKICKPDVYPYGCDGRWAKLYTQSSPEEEGGKSTYGALFIEFSVGGDPRKARGYFKNVNGVVVDPSPNSGEKYFSLFSEN